MAGQKNSSRNRNPRPRGTGSGSSTRATLDHYSLKAQKEGYPARSVYKLEEIQEKYAVLPRGGRILDIGASPGSWSLFILRNFLGSGFLAAVDLKPLGMQETPDPERFFFVQGDFFDPAVLGELKSRGPFDAVVSDAAPDTTGNRTVDTGRSASLVEGILALARELLVPGGTLTVKVFQGGEEQKLLARFRESFDAARMFKPRACRKDSFETYLIGTGFRKTE